jgi:hypothetical protein
MLRIVGMPAVFSVFILLYYLYDLKTNKDKLQPKINATSHAFFAVFFCYPTICIVSFATFICRQLTPDTSVLDADGTVICEDPSHRTIQAVSAVVIAVVSFGVPVVCAVVLMRLALEYKRNHVDSSGAHADMCRRAHEELGCDLSTATWVVRDVTIGRDFSFLMDAYTPQFLYWEALDMFQEPSWRFGPPETVSGLEEYSLYKMTTEILLGPRLNFLGPESRAQVEEARTGRPSADGR